MKKIFLAAIAFLPLLAFGQTKAPRPLFDKKTIGEVRLTLPSKNWVDALDSMRIYGMGMLNGAATVDGVKYEGVGVRFRGDKSYQLGLKRNPFTIRLNQTDASQNHQGYSSLKLSAALRDPSLVREMLFYEIAGKYMPAPQASFTRLYVNEEYVGVFVNVENVDQKFLNTHYGSSGNAFFKAGVDYKPETPTDCKQNIHGSLEYEDNVDCYKGNFEMLSASGWNELRDLAKALTTEPAKLDQVLDVDRTLWMLALDNVMVNLSSYIGNHSVNYFLYKDNNGRFQPIHWDLNLAFGSYKNTGMGSDLELKGLQELDPLLHADNPYKPLVSQLLKDPLNRKIYLSHIRQILDDNFLNGTYEKRAKELQGSVVVPLADDKYKYYSMDDFNRSLRETVGRKSKIPGIVELMGRRAKLLRGNEALSALPPAISEVTVQSRGKFENQKLDAFRITARADRFPKRMYIYYRLKEKDPYAMMMMTEETGKNLPTGAKEYSAVVEGKNADAVLDYYLVAENAGTVTFSPSAYTIQPNKVKLSDLNK